MRYSPNSWGAMLMAISMFSFVFNDGLMKVLFADMSIYQAIFLRGLVTAPLMALLALRAGVLLSLIHI